MVKRKFDDSHLPTSKRARVHLDIHDVQISNPQAHEPYTPPSSLANRERCKKRKRLLDSQPNISEQPEAKRARIRLDANSELWPGIGYSPCQEESNQLKQLCIASEYAALRTHEQYDSDICDDHQNPLPSPALSDTDATDRNIVGSDEREPPTATSILGTPRLLSHQRHRRRDRIPPNRKRHQLPKKEKEENECNKRRNKALQCTVEAIFRSKRSSRRDHNCELWQLGDDGSAREVPKAR